MKLLKEEQRLPETHIRLRKLVHLFEHTTQEDEEETDDHRRTGLFLPVALCVVVVSPGLLRPVVATV